jgi:methyl-accepting chemotaxis protein
LLWITSTLFIVTVISLSLSLWLGLKEKNAELATQVEIALKQEINDKLSARAGEYGERVAGFINEAYRIPFSFAGLLEQSSKKDPLSRERVELSVAAILQKIANCHLCTRNLNQMVMMVLIVNTLKVHLTVS